MAGGLDFDETRWNGKPSGPHKKIHPLDNLIDACRELNAVIIDGGSSNDVRALMRLSGSSFSDATPRDAQSNLQSNLRKRRTKKQKPPSLPSLGGGAVSLLETVDKFGLLGIVSVTLAVLTILVALVGIYAFFDVRRVSSRIAREEAEKIAKDVAETSANQYLQKELPGMIAAYIELAKNAATAEEADEIAKAQ